MTKLFEALLQMSLTSAYVVLLVLLLRLLLRRAPKIYSYALWAVVFFRMACPFSFTSPVSAVPQQVAALPPGVVPDTTAPIPALGEAIANPGTLASIVPAMPSVVEILAWVWGAGLVLLLCYSVVSYLLLRRRVAGAVPSKEAGCYVGETVRTPFVLGLWRPKIYLPLGLEEQERQYILCHESVHLARKDHFIRPLCFLLCCVHWFNPLCWTAFFLCCRDMEMSCDEAVVKKLGGAIRGDYSSSLLAMATRGHALAPAPLAFGEGRVGQRIKNILRYKKPALWVTAGCVLAVAVAAFCLLGNPATRDTMEWATTLRVEDVTNIVYSHRPTSPGREDTSLRWEDYATVVKLLNGARGRYLAQEPEPVVGGSMRYEVTTQDGQIHYVENIANIYLIIDGDYFADSLGWLHSWPVYDWSEEPNPQAALSAADMPIPTPTPEQHLSLLLGSGGLSTSGWSRDSDNLPSPDVIVGYYMALSALDSRIPTILPDGVTDPDTGSSIVPAGYIQRVGEACFGAGSDYLRQSEYYVAAEDGYILYGLGSVADCTVVEVRQDAEGSTILDFDMVWDGAPYAMGVLTVANLPDGGWQYQSMKLSVQGLTRQEKEEMAAVKSRFRAMTLAEQQTLLESGGVDCPKSLHLFWEDSIPLEFINLVGVDTFEGWVASAQEDGRCMDIYTFAKLAGWTVDALETNIGELGLAELIPPDRARIRAAVFDVPATIEEAFLEHTQEIGLTDSQANTLLNSGYTRQEILAMSFQEVVQSLAKWTDNSQQSTVRLLAKNWRDWQSIAADNTNYVWAVESGTVNLASLEAWVEAFRNGRPAEVYVMRYGSPMPIAYRLSCNGGKTYTVDYYINEEMQGSYAANAVYKRHFDYVFGGGETGTGTLKEPLTVPRMPADEKPAAGNQPGDSISPQQAVEAAKALLVDWYGAEVVYSWIPRAAARLLLYGEQGPYQVVDFFQSQEEADSSGDVGTSGNRVAVSADGQRMAIQSMVDGSWLAVLDKQQEAITAR